MTQPALVGGTPPATSSRSSPSGPRICFDSVFFPALPGKANYCLGLRDWENGHYQNGLQLLKLAAGWGNKSAQYTLGLIYYNGHHVPADRALGMAWLKLADQRHDDPQIVRAASAVARLATPGERARSKRLYERMLPKYGDAVATARAWHHLRHWQRSHSSSNTGTVCLYGAQLYAVRHAGMGQMGLPGISEALHAAQLQKNPQVKPARNCFGISVQMKHHAIRQSAAVYFAGWMGTVSVGPLETVPAPPSSSER